VLIASLAVFAAFAALLPLGYLVLRTFGGGAQGAFAELARPRTLELLGNTFALVIAVSLTALVIGFAQAWLTVRSSVYLAPLFALLAAMPLAIPSYVAAFSWLALFPAMNGFFASWLVLSVSTAPYVYLAVAAALIRTDTALEEVARSLGTSRLGVLRRVTWPSVRPAATAATLLVALYTLSEFGAIALLRYNTFTVAIYNAYRASFDRTAAAALALVLVAITLIVIAAERRARGGFVPQRAANQRRLRVELGPWGLPAAVALAVIAALGVGVPIFSLTRWSFIGSSRANPEQLLAALGNSLQYAVLAAAVISVFALAIAIFTVRYRSRLSALTERAVWLTHALPGIVVALALVFVGANLLPGIYQTVWLLIFAYLVLFLPNALTAMVTPVSQVPASLDEVAASLGLGRLRTLARVVLPLAAPGIIAGSALVALTVLKELPATLLLRPTGADTLATRLWSATEVVEFSAAAPYGLLLVLLAGLPALALNVQVRRALEGSARGKTAPLTQLIEEVKS
jgi:iron(III) transport system permease protein